MPETGVTFFSEGVNVHGTLSTPDGAGEGAGCQASSWPMATAVSETS